MTRCLFTWMLALLGAACVGCDAPEGTSNDAREAHEESNSETEARAETEAHTVRVERGMLRDLRVTTQVVTSRPAGDAVTVLGELRVNEDAYAEVGTSIPARVSRALVAPGDMVSAGQALVELESPDVGRARADLLSARARLELARQTTDRRRALAAETVRELRAELQQVLDLLDGTAPHGGAR